MGASKTAAATNMEARHSKENNMVNLLAQHCVSGCVIISISRPAFSFFFLAKI
jgi:hypothetical protein